MKLLLFLCGILLFTACKNENDGGCLGCYSIHGPTTYTDRIYGQIFLDCNLTPDPNDEVLITLNIGGEDNIVKHYSLVTDSDGHFKDTITFTIPNTIDDGFSLRVDLPKDSVEIYSGSPHNETFTILKTIGDSAHFLVKLNASESYTSADTLFYNISNGTESTPFYYSIGPFRDTILNELSFPSRKLLFLTADSVYSYLNWGIGFKAFNAAITDFYSPDKIVVKHAACSAVDSAEIQLK